MAEKRDFSSYSYSEATTGLGQLVEFTCNPEDIPQIKKTLAITRTVELPTTRRVNVGHGGCGRYTRFDITQHKYAGGGYPGYGGFIEALEIKDAPDSRCGNVLHEDNSRHGASFAEFDTVDHAVDAFSLRRDLFEEQARLAKLPGFLRYIRCGELTPWFYAIGEQQLVGDYAFPEHLQQDAVFKFGKQFVVEDEETGLPTVRTCMGARLFEEKREYGGIYSAYERKEFQRRIVYWSDGSSLDINNSSVKTPRPLRSNEMWITEAVKQFESFLAGKTAEFTLDFADGTKFVGKMIERKTDSRSKTGRYYVVVTFKDQPKREGWFDFEPSEEAPTVQQYLRSRLQRVGQIAKIRIQSEKAEKGGKRWSGVFFNPS